MAGGKWKEWNRFLISIRVAVVCLVAAASYKTFFVNTTELTQLVIAKSVTTSASTNKEPKNDTALVAALKQVIQKSLFKLKSYNTASTHPSRTLRIYLYNMVNG